jgi:hypothetical protein
VYDTEKLLVLTFALTVDSITAWYVLMRDLEVDAI